jgi:hypothetical protein
MDDRQEILECDSSFLNDESGSASSQNKKEILRSILDRTPRLFYLVCFIVFPTIALIGICYACGYWLASLEISSENAKNDGLVRAWAKKTYESIPRETFADCSEQYQIKYLTSDNEFANLSHFTVYVEECFYNGLNDILKTKIKAEIESIGLQFHWTTCNSQSDSQTDLFSNNESNPRFIQATAVLTNWYNNFVGLYEENIKYFGDDVAVMESIKEASGTKDICRINSTGGAFFWYTIITTIGYGQTSPITASGRTLVGLVGYFCILLFSAALNVASEIMMIICDDLCKRMNFEASKNRIISLFFFFVIIGIAYFITILLGMNHLILIFGSEVWRDQSQWSDMAWWAYISVTTVGLGDIAPPYESFRFIEVFTMPILMMPGLMVLSIILNQINSFVLRVLPIETLSKKLADQRKKIALKQKPKSNG